MNINIFNHTTKILCIKFNFIKATQPNKSLVLMSLNKEIQIYQPISLTNSNFAHVI